jgi:hypothetical protein
MCLEKWTSKVNIMEKKLDGSRICSNITDYLDFDRKSDCQCSAGTLDQVSLTRLWNRRQLVLNCRAQSFQETIVHGTPLSSGSQALTPLSAGKSALQGTSAWQT